MDSASFARSVREDTAELASYVLSDKKDRRSTSFLNRISSTSSHPSRDQPVFQNELPSTGDLQSSSTDTIDEVSEPSSLASETDGPPNSRPSALTTMFKRSPPESLHGLDTGSNSMSQNGQQLPSIGVLQAEPDDELSETTPLLRRVSHRPESPDSVTDIDIEIQKPKTPPWGPSSTGRGIRDRIRAVKGIMNPKTWDKKVVWRRAIIDPIHCLPAVIVGLLLNILDALSYGKLQSRACYGPRA